MEDIINDQMVINGLANKKIAAADRDDENLNIKDFSYEEYYKMLIRDNHWLTEEIEKDPNYEIKYTLKEGGEELVSSALESIKSYVEHNNYYLQDLLDAMAELGIKASSDLDKLVNLSGVIENRKQSLLLLGVSSQLFSLLCLLFLFRRLLMVNRLNRRT